MKINALLVSFLVCAACGGSKKPVAAPADDRVVEKRAPRPEPEEEPEPPPPPPPQQWHAAATLAPVKGSKMKAATVRFAQTEGENVHVTSDGPFAGLGAGVYHLVIHEATDCGKNATKAGPAWAEADQVALMITVGKGKAATPPTLDEMDVALMLDGDVAIIGRTLVLHADKKGAPAKAVACGTIMLDETASGDGDDGDGDDDDGDGDE